MSEVGGKADMPPKDETERPKTKTAVELRLDIERIQRRIAEVEKFDADAVTERRGPQQSALQSAIDDTLQQVFGKNSSRYQAYRSGTSLDRGPLSMLGPPPIATIRQYTSAGKARTLAMLNQAIKSIEEEIADLEVARDQHAKPAGKQMMDSAEFARYSNAAVCLHGHPLTADIEYHPSAKFCSECGAEVITSCPDCAAPLRGHYVPPGVTGVGGSYSPPSFCFSCGKPLPWTTEKLAD